MSLILHGTWLGERGAYFVWGEASEAPRARRGRRLKVPMHPYQAPPAALSERLPRAGDYPDHTLTLWLPTTEAAPVPSPELLATGALPAPNGAVRLAPWHVTGRLLPIDPALDWLIGLEAEAPFGADVHAWRAAALLALALVAGQEVLPGFQSADGALVARWLPRPGPATRQQLAALARALPPLCRAATDAAEAAPGPRALVEGFVAAAVDATVRRVSYKPHLKPSTPGGRWLAALLRPRDARVRLDETDADALLRAWQQWTAAAEVAGDDVFRLTFRLEPPPASEGEWRLAYLLQATDDPSLLVPASRLWREHGAEFTYLDRRFEHPQEKLLRALGHAARLYPPIADSLRRAAPAGARLNGPEAYAFLREAAPLLEASGFGVLVPAWWKAGRAARLQARAHVASPKAEAPGKLNFETLVQFRWEVTLDGETISAEELRRLAGLKQPLVKMRGQWVVLEGAPVEQALKLLDKAQAALPLEDVLRLSLGGAAEAATEALPVEGVQADGWVSGLIEKLRRPAQLEAVAAPRGLHGQLRPYQQRGFAWLAFLRQFGLGACLADDMGLGKTIQTIALLLHERERLGVSAPALLVCPTSVVGNWQRELEHFAPGLKVVVHRGGARQRGQAFAAGLAGQDVVLTSFPLLARDRATLTAVEWSTAVLDEAQNIKNPATRQAQAARALRARNRVALTGTPVENRLGELWSIMAYLNPGYLGSEASFRREFARPIERLGDAAAAERLRRLTAPFVLRRVKTDPRVIADLPEKLEMKVYCPLTREQASLYAAVVRDALAQVEAAEADSIERRGLVLAMLTKLKQVCNHPAQFLQDGSPLPGRSGKLARLGEMLEEAAAEGDRALVFTQYAAMGAMLQRYLRERLSDEVLFLHGGTPARERDGLVRRFQAPRGPRVFVLSLKAGGTGLNLTAANRVFHFDRWWNPAVEDQATDRAFRIGQRRNVQVHKLVCGGTLEDRIDELIESKRALADNVLGAGEGWLTELSTRELRALVQLRGGAGDVVEAEP